MSVSQQFIDELFSNDYFKQSLLSFRRECEVGGQGMKQNLSNFQIETVLDDITEALQTNFKSSIQKQCRLLYDSNRLILEQIQNLRNKVSNSLRLKTESSTAERDNKSKFQTSLFFQGDEHYDMKQIRENIDQIQCDISNKVLTESFELEQQEKTFTDLQIQQKINASIEGSINRIQLSLEEKFEKYSQKLQQRIQQLKRTITSVVQAMNDPQYWGKDKAKSNLHLQKSITHNAFAKKQIKINQKTSLNNNVESPEQNQNKNKTKQMDESQNDKYSAHSNSNKTIQTLNKSLNIGRSKIKSLFGFKSSNIKHKNEQRTV